MYKFKVCCIQSKKEAELSISVGAHAIGLVAEMPSGPGPISLDQINDIANHVQGEVETWLLTSKVTLPAILKEYEAACTDTIQLVDEVSEKVCKGIKMRYPEINLVQVRHVQPSVSVSTLARAHRHLSALLLDSGRPQEAIKILGGTGLTHDWSKSKKIIATARVPVFLAGGLTPENVEVATDIASPFGVDVCSGLRTDGKLDKQKLNKWADVLSKY